MFSHKTQSEHKIRWNNTGILNQSTIKKTWLLFKVPNAGTHIGLIRDQTDHVPHLSSILLSSPCFIFVLISYSSLLPSNHSSLSPQPSGNNSPNITTGRLGLFVDLDKELFSN